MKEYFLYLTGIEGKKSNICILYGDNFCKKREKNPLHVLSALGLKFESHFCSEDHFLNFLIMCLKITNYPQSLGQMIWSSMFIYSIFIIILTMANKFMRTRERGPNVK